MTCRKSVCGPLLVVAKDQEYFLTPDGALTGEWEKGYPVSPTDIRDTMDYIGSFSLYAYEDELRQGFLTVEGGHRIGIAGKTVIEGEKVKGISHISCINVRVAHEKKGCADRVMPYLWEDGRFLHTLIVSAPGCGKTTIGKLIAGLYRPSGGRITLFGKPQNPKQLQKQVLFILQEAEFQFFTSSVLHELQYGHAVTPAFEAKTEALLKSMDMWECRDRHPFSLSGGQMQRLTLMMAYLSDKPIVILDEPTAGQDAESLARCAALIREMRREKTVLIITHDLELIADACDYCIGLSDGRAETEFPVHSERDLQAVRQYMERFHPSDIPAKKQHQERFHPATKLLYWLALLVVISTSNNHLVYATYAALILLTAADGWFGTALAGGMSFGLLWAANALLPGTVFSFMLVLFPRIIAVGISMRTLIGRNEASRTLAALRNLHLPERLIMIVAVIFRFFPVLSGDMKLLRQSIATRGAFATPLQKLRALPSYIEILTVPMALRVIRIAETLSASAETRGIDLKRRKSNYLSLRFSAWDVVFCVLLAALIAAGLIL